jgi:hypothetical protein
MQIDPKIVEAAKITQEDKENLEHAIDDAEPRARRVLKAASECVPDEAVDAAGKAFAKHLPELGDPDYKAKISAAMRAALSAALDKWAEEE